MNNEKFNEWSNYATWEAYTMIANTESLYNYFKECPSKRRLKAIIENSYVAETGEKTFDIDEVNINEIFEAL